MIWFTGEVDGIEQMSRGFNRVENFISDFRNIWPLVAKEFYQIEEEQFTSEGAKGASGRWAPLSKAYAKWKAVKFPGKTILRRTDSLFDALTGPEAPGAIYRPLQTELTIGASVPYGVYHQRGMGLPARPPISLSESQKRQIQKAIQLGLVAFVRRQGFEVLENAA